jgi:hypothetical protein
VFNTTAMSLLIIMPSISIDCEPDSPQITATASASASGFPGPLPQFRPKLQKTASSAALLQPQAAARPRQLGKAATLPNLFLAPPPLINNVVTPGDAAALALFAKYHVPWGVQLAVASCVSEGRLSWSDLTPEECSHLGGSHVDAGQDLLEQLGQVRGQVHYDLKLW